MTRYVAFLRGVSPLNAKMPELKRAFEQASFEDVTTVLGSGNVVFNARRASEQALAKKAEAAMTKALGRSFLTFVRSVESLEELIDADPFSAFKLKPGSKRVVTFLGTPPTKRPKLPLELDGAHILGLQEQTAFGCYIPGPNGPVFMTLLEKTFGKDITTRTWDTVIKVTKK